MWYRICWCVYLLMEFARYVHSTPLNRQMTVLVDQIKSQERALEVVLDSSIAVAEKGKQVAEELKMQSQIGLEISVTKFPMTAGDDF